MRKQYSYLLFLVLLVAFSSGSYAQIIPSSANLGYLLNPKADIHLTHKVISKTNTNWIILNVSTRNAVQPDSLLFSYTFTDDLDNPLNNIKEVSLKNYELYQTATTKMYAFEPANNTFKFLILRVLHVTNNKGYTYIINLEKSSPFFVSKTNLTIPILTGYSAKETPLKLAKLDGSTSNFGVQFYSTKFSASLPPMGNLKTKNPFSKADTSFSISDTNLLPSTIEGTYSIFEEHNENLVSFFRIANSRHPQLSTIEEIIEASIFLLTKKENDKLTTSTHPKKDYDAFWLDNTNSSERAAKMISAYFSRVKEANTLFSTYKEGWKTDMGMIYIIFGPPDKMFRSNKKVEWVYKKTYEMPSMLFGFYLKNKKLDSEYFELERNMRYQSTWFRAIDLWRKGRKNL